MPRTIQRIATPEPVGVVDILVASETPIDGLAKEHDDAVPAVPARAAIREHAARQCGQPERVVQFAISDKAQPRVGGYPRSVEFQFQAAVEKGPEWPMIRFTLGVPHPSRPPTPSSQ